MILFLDINIYHVFLFAFNPKECFFFWANTLEMQFAHSIHTSIQAKLAIGHLHVQLFILKFLLLLSMRILSVFLSFQLFGRFHVYILFQHEPRHGIQALYPLGVAPDSVLQKHYLPHNISKENRLPNPVLGFCTRNIQNGS